MLMSSALCCQLVGNGLVSYYLAPILRLLGITNPAQQGGINAGLAMFNLLAAAIGAQFVERWGRRPLWLTGAVGMFFSFVVVTGLSVSRNVPSTRLDVL